MTTMTAPNPQDLFITMARKVSKNPNNVLSIQMDTNGNFITTQVNDQKRCTKCWTMKDPALFYRNAKSPDKRETVCKMCRDAQ